METFRSMGCDAFRVYESETESNIVHEVRKLILARTLETFRETFVDECSLFRSVLASPIVGGGYKEGIGDALVLAKRDTIQTEDILSFLLAENYVDHVLLVIDNLDECTSATMKTVHSFAKQLRGQLRRGPLFEKLSILFPLRNYTANRYSDTFAYPQVPLPSLDYAGIFKGKLEDCRHRIQLSARSASCTLDSAESDHGIRRKETLRSQTFEVTPDHACDFLKEAGDKLLSDAEDRETYDFLYAIAAGNCRYLVASTYYTPLQFSPSTMLSANDTTKEYLEWLIFEPSYLQYVCEDVPMPKEFIVPITDKYARRDVHGGSKKARLRSAIKLVEFIELEEKNEWEGIRKRQHYAENTFLNRFCIARGQSHVRLSEIMKGETLPAIARKMKGTIGD